MNSLNTLAGRQLGQLYADLLAITPRGSLPFVTLTNEAAAPFGAVVIGRHEILASAAASTLQGVVDLIAARLPAGRGEVLA